MSSSSRRGRSSSSDDGANSAYSTPIEDGDDSTMDSGTQNGAGNSDDATMASMLSFVTYRPGTLADGVTDGCTSNSD